MIREKRPNKVGRNQNEYKINWGYYQVAYFQLVGYLASTNA